METIIVTRHPALVDFLRERGVLPEHYGLVNHATPEDVRGKHVVGVLPLHLAALAAKVTEVPMDVPFDIRGKELGLGEMKKYARTPVTYVVRTETAYESELRDARLGG